MTRYRVLEILGGVLAVVGFVVMGIGGASLLLNLSSIPWARVATFILAPGDNSTLQCVPMLDMALLMCYCGHRWTHHRQSNSEKALQHSDAGTASPSPHKPARSA